MLRFFLPILLVWITAQSKPEPLFRRDVNSAADSLEIVILRVQFATESPDNTQTTGTGHFDSDADTIGAHYTLDPQGQRSSSAYWQKQISHAADYFAKASRGKLLISSRVYPTDSTVYTLPKHIVDYNRTARINGEKIGAFDSSQTSLYASFLRDAIRIADTTGISPFDLPPNSDHHYRVYMIAHAGSDRLTDGGSLGTRGANTPGDFLDLYADTSYFRFLKLIPGAQSDSLGIVLNRTAVDTLREILCLPETYSQDKVNWGLSGMLIHQIARSIGLPVTYNASTGAPRLGMFDLMDFGGANAGNGFFPVLPMAWMRAYMGWESVIIATPQSNGTYNDKIFSATDSSLGTHILKIPLTADEYLLVENRQRTNSPSQNIAIQTDLKSVNLAADSLALFFQDSICSNNKCTAANSQKGSGVILSVSNLDAGIPGSGLAVWHINEWLLRQYIQTGAANLNLINNNDHDMGISLVEADGLSSMGKTFTGQSGSPSYDYGSGAKLFPHQRWTSKGKVDSIFSLEPSGYASTMTSTAAQTGVRLQFAWPDSAKTQKSVNPINGDSIANPEATWLPITVQWQSSPTGYSQAFNIPSQGNTQASAFNLTRAGLTLISNQGTSQAFQVDGLPWVNHFDSVKVYNGYAKAYQPLSDKSLSDTQTILIPSFDHQIGKTLLGSASNDSVWVALYRDQLVWFKLKNSGDSLLVDSALTSKVVWTTKALTSPMLQNDSLWWGGDSLYLANLNNSTRKTWPWPGNFIPQSLALSANGPVFVGLGAQIARFKGDSLIVLNPMAKSNISDLKQQFFRIAVSNFEGGSQEYYAIVGSRGTVAFMDSVGNLRATPMRLARGQKKAGTIANDGTYPDSTDIAIGDINGDGKSELIFTGYNGLFAVNGNGSHINGFPWSPSMTPVGSLNAYKAPGQFGSSPLLVQLNQKNAILISSPDGNVYAIDGSGRTLSGWPLALGAPQGQDSTQANWWHLALRSQGSSTRLFAAGPQALVAYDLKQSQEFSWSQASGGAMRQNRVMSTASDTSLDLAVIKQFYSYPNPVRGTQVNLLIELGAEASSANIKIFSSSSSQVRDLNLANLPKGQSEVQNFNLGNLGTDIYAARLEVQFTSGKKATKWFRLAIIR